MKIEWPAEKIRLMAGYAYRFWQESEGDERVFLQALIFLSEHDKDVRDTLVAFAAEAIGERLERGEPLILD
jgi:hypothetical protein